MEEKKYSRKCPFCDNICYYKQKGHLTNAEKKNKGCKSCWRIGRKKYASDHKHIRNCPKCNKELAYTKKSYFNFCVKNNTLCLDCGYIATGEKRSLLKFIVFKIFFKFVCRNWFI